MKLDPALLAQAKARRLEQITAQANADEAAKAIAKQAALDAPREWPSKIEIIKLRLSPCKSKWFVGLIHYPTCQRFFLSVERSNNGLASTRHPATLWEVQDGMRTLSDFTRDPNNKRAAGFTPACIFFSEPQLRQAAIDFATRNL